MFRKCYFLTVLLIVMFVSNLWAGLGSLPDIDVSGRWFVIARGHRYILDITLTHNIVTGILMPAEEKSTFRCLVYGHIDNELIIMHAHNQALTFFLDFKGVVMGRGKSMVLKGTVQHNHIRIYDWYAVRHDNKSIPFKPKLY